MVEDELRELLLDYKNMAESEHSAFVSSLMMNSNFVTLVFNSLQTFEERSKNTEVLPILCDLLFNIYRRDPEYRHFALQFLPHLAFVYLINYGDKQQFGCIETWLVAIHNIEAKDPISFRIPKLTQNSIYHEPHSITDSRIINSPPEVPGDKSSYNIVEKTPLPQVKSLNSQNKLPIIGFLLGVFSGLLVEMSRLSVEFNCKLATRMVTRGFNIGGRKTHRRTVSYGSDPGMRSPRILPARLSLSSSVLLELLQLGYFAIFHESHHAGMCLIRDIEFRAKHGSMDSVLLVSRALIKMAPHGPSVEEQRYISTPSQLSKNIITNASFRTKKLETDIPRVEPDEEGGTGSLDASKLMMAIVEEEGEVREGEAKKSKDGENITDKIKARMENVTSRMESVRIPNILKKGNERQSESTETNEKEKGRGSEKRDKKKEKKEGKEGKECKSSSEQPDGLEEIRMQSIPSETIAIHSPESGSTSIF